MCLSRPLEPFADYPRPWGGLSAVQNFEPTDLQTSLTKSGSDRRTVRSPGADRPQYDLQAQTELQSLWTKMNYTGGPSAQHGRTVRPSFLFLTSWSTSTPRPSPLQMCQQHQVNNTMCMCVRIFTIIFKGFLLDLTTPLNPSNITMLDRSSGTRWPICK